MARCDWVILCDYAFQDANGKTGMIGVFDHIAAKKVPMNLPTAAMVVRLTGDAGEKVRYKIEMKRPSGENLNEVNGGCEFHRTATISIVLGMANLNIPDYGEYSLEVSIDGKFAKKARFQVSRPASPIKPVSEKVH